MGAAVKAPMMVPNFIEKRIPSPEGIAPGRTATWKLPIGVCYRELQLTFSGVTLAQINEIRVLANGRPFQTFSGADRNAMNMFDGRADAATDGELIIPLQRSKLKTGQAEWETGVTTGVADQSGRRIDSLNVEIDIDAGAAAPVMELTASQSQPSPAGPGTLLHITRFRRNLSGVGEFDVSDLPFGTPTTMMLNRCFMKEDGQTVTKAKIERETRVIWERTAAKNKRIQSDGVRAPQAGWFVIDKTERGYGADAIGLMGYNDFRYQITTDGQQSLTMYVETLGILGN